MGTKLSSEEADGYMTYFSTVAVMSVIGNIWSIWILLSIKHNVEFFPSKLVTRICFSSGTLSLIQLFNPNPDGSSNAFTSDIEILPVVNVPCYVQSVVSIALTNLSIFWQCCLIHNVYEVAVRKNQRPEDLLMGYDNKAVLLAVVASLGPWAVQGYGWQWFGRCKYNTYANGKWANVLTSIVHFLCILYIIVISVQMYRRLVHEESMITDYHRLPGLKRKWAHQQKYIFASWFFVVCKAPDIITSAMDLLQFLYTGHLLTQPDDLPFILVGLNTVSNGIYGVVLCGVLIAFDWKKIKCLQNRCGREGYSCGTGKFITYQRQDRAVCDKKIIEAEDRDCGMHHLMSQRLKYNRELAKENGPNATLVYAASEILETAPVFSEEEVPAAWETATDRKSPEDFKLSFTTLLLSQTEAHSFKQHKDRMRVKATQGSSKKLEAQQE